MPANAENTELISAPFNPKSPHIQKRIAGVLALLAIWAVFFLAGCGGEKTSGDNPKTDISAQNQPSERFVLRNIYGKKYRWSEFVGKPFIINFWATWCGPCRAEIPGMINVYKEYKSRGLEIVAISLDDARTVGQVVPFVDQFMIPWIVLYGDQSVIDEFRPGQSIPVTLFFDAQGKETARLIGAQPETVFRRELEKLYGRRDQT